MCVVCECPAVCVSVYTVCTETFTQTQTHTQIKTYIIENKKFLETELPLVKDGVLVITL